MEVNENQYERENPKQHGHSGTFHTLLCYVLNVLNEGGWPTI